MPWFPLNLAIDLSCLCFIRVLGSLLLAGAWLPTRLAARPPRLSVCLAAQWLPGGEAASPPPPRSSGESGGTKRATSANMPLLRLQSSEGKFTMSREIGQYAGPSAGTEVARFYGSGTLGAFWAGRPEESSSRSRSARRATRRGGRWSRR